MRKAALRYFTPSQSVVIQHKLDKNIYSCVIKQCLFSYIGLNGRMIVNEELEGMWKEAVLTCI
jgi:hypothetical protein